MCGIVDAGHRFGLRIIVRVKWLTHRAPSGRRHWRHAGAPASCCSPCWRV